jgi:hypothetical protein
MREVLLGTDPPVSLTRRAESCLHKWREDEAAGIVHPVGSLVTRVAGDVRWWTWAGYRANATLAATLASVADPVQRPTDCWVRLREDWTVPGSVDTGEGRPILRETQEWVRHAATMNVGMPPRSRNHRPPAACDAPTAIAASSLVIPVAIWRQNSRSTSRRSDGAPGDFIGALPVNAVIHAAGLPINSSAIKGVATTS